MLRKAHLLFLVPAVIGSAHAAIDLTPSVTEFVEEGITYREVTFKSPEGKVQITLSPGWTIRGQNDRAHISRTDNSAEAAIERIPLQKPEPLDEAAIAKFKERVLANLPAGSTKVTPISEVPNSLTPGGNPSFEFVVTYDLWGKIYQRSALLVNGPQDRLLFRFTSLKQDFELLNTQFRRTAMTWRAIETKQLPGPVVADAGPARTAN